MTKTDLVHSVSQISNKLTAHYQKTSNRQYYQLVREIEHPATEEPEHLLCVDEV